MPMRAQRKSCDSFGKCGTVSKEVAAMHYVLFYEVVDNYVERRAPLRADHLALARQSHERGEMVIAGALTDPVDGALLVFSTQEAADAFANNDPYVQNGLVTRWWVRKWATVIGPGAEDPGPTR
jgi:uncharacterized protein